ncbi:MAG: tetratricopeptide repeat protein [Blastocatellia bacterium]|nr:tetratricopeptide repeat protein [Blastocatellia bacterium]
MNRLPAIQLSAISYKADNAVRVYATAEAERHYSHALELVEKLPAGERDERSLTIYQKRGAANFTLSRFDEAIEDYERAIEGAQAAGAIETEQAALNGLINALFYSHRVDEMARRAEETLELAERGGSAFLRLETLSIIIQKHASYGEMDEAGRLADEVIELAGSLDHKQALLNGLAARGEAHFHQSEYARAEELLERALALAIEMGDGFTHLYALFFLGLSRGNQGRMSEALAALNEMMAVAERNGDRFWLSRVPNSIGWIHRELQDFSKAFEYDRRGVEIAQQDRVLEAEANSLINLGYDHTQAGEGRKSQAAFREVESIFKRDSWMAWRYNIRLQAGKAEYWLAQGDSSRAEEYARQLFEVASRYKSRKYMVVARKLLAEMAIARGDAEEADSELKAALEILEEFPAPLVAWRVYALLGRLNLNKGDDLRAREAFSQAAAIVREIAASVTDERLRTVFLESAAVKELIDRA